MSAIQNRYEFVLLFDVENGNPNGDPDAGNLPRIDPETNHGLITDVCLKRKVRNFVELAKGGESPFCIYVREKAVLSATRAGAYQSVEGKAKTDAEKVRLGRDFMCANFYDVRSFGAVMSTKENNCGQVRGPVQFSFARSVEPVTPLDVTITRMAVEAAKDASDTGDNRTMGRKHIVPYGLYRANGFISAPLAAQTGFSEADLELFWQALSMMFDHDHSAARGTMSARRLIVFKHDNALGSAPAHKLFDLVKIDKTKDKDIPARSYGDYAVTVDAAALPAGVTLEEKI
ncbi:CRISPR-associated protein, Csd2 family [Humidesulfovibrio mexicanus]|uniref:CRISPR-associated protein, Csd2 family n=1 Tax=Humidesulfovibrio mexicanus TaxID=147047 RepID=A0A239AJQ8_9BACT|nr:type I-C CRISPR-associated protein Cas7/Csd2 [Humidesulfovibrio mexicanus]SNR95905.1 CRISPR-associated protein, Csd2 family [Humidesulfovibrio mexicanus]